ncbi:uncharacterized protein FPRN_06780 [Fusarium proliferatum]|nr:uncharacterized protein FPRN_06780 [Fusarium proliferatum]
MSLPNVRSTTRLLARIMIAKIEDEDRIVEIIRNTPVVQNDPNWQCRTWVADVLSRTAQDGGAVGTAELDWAKIEPVAREYVVAQADLGHAAGKRGSTVVSRSLFLQIGERVQYDVRSEPTTPNKNYT